MHDLLHRLRDGFRLHLLCVLLGRQHFGALSLRIIRRLFQLRQSHSRGFLRRNDPVHFHLLHRIFLWRIGDGYCVITPHIIESIGINRSNMLSVHIHHEDRVPVIRRDRVGNGSAFGYIRLSGRGNDPA